jgi:serine phosphatase RsbU (regulator of sigma subunit)/CHASE1-domain containing sensor protein
VPTDPARPLLRWQRSLVLALVALVAVAAVMVAILVTRAQAHRRAEDVAQQAADVSAGLVSQLMSGMSGGAGLVAGDGAVDLDAFDAYALDVVEQSPAGALGFVSVVADADRAAFERAIDAPIVDEVGGEPAADRPLYYVITRVTPTTEANAGLVGVDLGIDPVRSRTIERALAERRTMISAPLASLPSGQPAIFIAKPVFRPGAGGVARTAEPVGLVTTGYPGSYLVDEISRRLPHGTRLEIKDGDDILAVTDPAPAAGIEQQLEVGDRRWTVTVAAAHGVRYGAAWLVALTGVVVVGSLALVLLRGSQYERRLRESTEAMSRLAELSQELAVATDVADLARAVSRHVPAIVGGDLAGVAVVEQDDGVVRMVPHPDIPAGLAATFGEIDLDAPSPVAASARNPEVRLLTGAAELRDAMTPRQADALSAAGFSSVGLAPLLVQGSVTAVVGVAWRSSIREGGPEEAALRTVSEVCTSTLGRIEAGGVIVDREAGLAALARKLSTAVTYDEVTAAMSGEASKVVGAVHANVGILEPGGAALVVRQSTLPRELAERYRRLPLDAGVPMTDAFLRNETVWVEDADALRDRYPGITQDAVDAGFAALVALPLCSTEGTPMGVLGMAWSSPLRVDVATRSTLHTLADMAAQTYERVGLADEHLREGELNRKLAEVGERLAVAGSTEEVVTTLADMAAGAVGASSASVGVLDTARRILHMVATTHDDGWIVSLDQEPRSPEAVAVASRASAVGGVPVGGDGVDEETTVTEPLLDHRRQPVGTLTVTFGPGEVVEPRTRRGLVRLAEMAGQALERATITDAEHRRTSLLGAYATRLSAARSVAEVIEVVLSAGGLPVDGDEVRVGLVDEARDVLVVHEVESPGGNEPRELPLETGLDPITDAVLRREPVVVGNIDEWRRHYPARGAEAALAGLESTAALQLRWADGRPLGMVSVAWRRARRFDDQTHATLHLIARLAAQSLQRAALRDIEHQVIADLQDRLVTDLPETPGLKVAARYRAAGAGLEVGGDWFAGFPLEDGRLGLIVGDMTGHGINAVADMAQVRAMTSALLRAGLSLEEVADQASQFVAESASAVATAMIAILDPAAGRLSCIVAGQVPPMLVHPDGTTEVLDGFRRPLLGVPRVEAGPLVEHRALPPGSLFVAYTDGLVERRGELIDDGIARLRSVLRRERSSPEAMADRVLAQMVGRQNEDDVALVIVQAEARTPTEPTEAGRQGLVATPNA